MGSNHIATSAFSLALTLAALVVSEQSGTSSDAQSQIPTDAVAVLRPTQGNEAQGVIVLSEKNGKVTISGEVTGLTPGKHGFHIHEFGDLRDPKGMSAGGHYNPTNVRHGAPDDQEHHVGDLGNIVANEDGVAKVDVETGDLDLHFAMGRALVVHGGEDDFKSQPSGDAGPRVAIGIIGYAQSESGSASSNSRNTQR